MNKLILITVILSICCCINNASQYINFTPYETSCSSSSIVGGIGYSIQLNTCFAISSTDNGWLFTYNNESGSITGTEYINQVGQPLCDSASRKINSVLNFNIDDCFNKALEFSSKTSPITVPFYQVSVSNNKPSLPIDMVQAYSYMLDSCNSTTLIGMEYLTNSSQAYNEINNSWQIDIYMCSASGVPIVIDPIYERTGDTCTKSFQFLNTTGNNNNNLPYTYIYQHCI